MWGEAFKSDKKHRLKLNKEKGRVEKNNFYVSENANSEEYKNSSLKRLSEDFADSVMRFLDPKDESFADEYPKRCDILEEIFRGIKR
ncbi:hypothetical protein [Methanobrevibacter woesei]|uniref:hypothetical protein n=1 Tax=Methanobrevibacter woesei TaxID=190976 RepID=UPI0023575CC3|nr:hypothetical protein [Methanobrevibacter woesei]